jgi:carbon-monoxide dehydrogenase small subunit
MREITLTVNGKLVHTSIEPRLHLGDFLRDHLRLTGTHLACEHGVCGACTIEIDGTPARSCIAFTAACDGASIRTIEGFEDDALMADLREAFSAEHALQCGFCTPGMLISARDIVQRLPVADEHTIRTELAGNLCRCTGYQGIANAIKRVIDARRVRTAAPGPAPGAGAAPVFVTFKPLQKSPAVAAEAPAATEPTSRGATDRDASWTEMDETFVIARPPEEVWAALDDLPMIVACLPGAELTERNGINVKGRMRVKLGVIRASFRGAATIERNESALSAIFRGGGTDVGTSSRTRGEVEYRLRPEGVGSTRVGVSIRYRLQGPLAQFSRSSLVRNFAARLVTQFSSNLNARLDQQQAGPVPSSNIAFAQHNVGVINWLKAKIAAVLRREK